MSNEEVKYVNRCKCNNLTNNRWILICDDCCKKEIYKMDEEFKNEQKKSN